METTAFYLTGFTAIAGLVLGFILGLNGFAQPAGAGALAQSPRIKNLVWLFSGLFPIFVADFTKLGLPKDFPWFYPFLGYGVAALLGAVAAILWTVSSITRSVRAFNSARPRAWHLDVGLFQREYLTYGKPRYEELWKIKTDEAEAARKRAAAEVKADKTIAQCVYSVLRHLTLSREAQAQGQEALIDTIMEAIVAVVQAHSGADLVLRGSFMTYHATGERVRLPGAPMFTEGMPDNYNGYLVLRRGGGLPLRGNIILPVATDQTKVLPGAPEAVHVLGIAVMNLRNMGFRAGVSAPARKAITSYFADPYFAQVESIISLVVLSHGRVHGVMNVESSARNLLGEDPAAVAAVAARLQTLIALLSIFSEWE